MNASAASNSTESTEELNARYATALLPFTLTLGGFIAIGLFGNILTIIVFSLNREFSKNNFKVFVVALAVIDIFTCVTLLPVEIFTHRNYFMFPNEAVCKIKCFLTVFGASASCITLLVISVDRFQKVVRPFRKQLRPGVTVKILVCVSFIVPTLIAVPGSIMCGIHRTNMTNDFGEQTVIYFCETVDKYRFSVWRSIYKYFLLFTQLGISCVYIVLYTFVMKEASKQIAAINALNRKSLFDVNSTVNENGETYTKDITADKNIEDLRMLPAETNSKTNKISKSKHDKVPPRQVSNKSLTSAYTNGFPTKTMVWFVLTLIFVITYIAHLCLTLKVSDIVNMSTTEFTWFVTFFRCYFVNHIINPFIYAIFIKRFRETCAELLETVKAKCYTHHLP